MTDKPYPPRMQIKKGRLYHVHQGKWTPLGPADDYEEAERRFNDLERQIVTEQIREHANAPWKRPKMAPIKWLEKNAKAFHYTDEEIINRAVTPPLNHDGEEGCGVYFIVNDGRIDYVGLSTSVDTRIRQHQSIRRVESVFFIRVPEILCAYVETYYLARVQPPHNVDLPMTKAEGDFAAWFRSRGFLL